MGFALRWLASGLIASLIAQTVLYSLRPLALHFIAFATITAILNIALSWRVSAGARGWAMVLGLSIILGMTVLTLVMPGAWVPWF
jgi:hypothetical protein